jgi:hypothetical protein
VARSERLKKKLGSYPSISLSKARGVFSRDFADMFQKGRSIKIADDTRPGPWLIFSKPTSLIRRRRESRPGKKRRKASTRSPIRSAGIAPLVTSKLTNSRNLIRPIYDRGKRSKADHVRSYIRSAYSWGLKSEHDYRSASQRRFHSTGTCASFSPPAMHHDREVGGRVGALCSCAGLTDSQWRQAGCGARLGNYSRRSAQTRIGDETASGVT